MDKHLEQRALGRHGLEVGVMGLGGVPFGDPHTVRSEADAQAILEAAWHGGLRLFDTAPWYGHTKSEHRMGQFLRDKPRDDFKLSTKVGRLYGRPVDPRRWRETEHGQRWAGGLAFVPRFDYSGPGVVRSYEDSLQRLGLNRVDCLVIHDLDPRHQRGEAGVERALEQLDAGGGYRELSALRERGEIQAIGAGINHVGMIPRFLERFDLDYFLVAMPYTLADQEALDGDFQLCESRGVQVVIGSVFASGILADSDNPAAQYGYRQPTDDERTRVHRIREVCAQHDVSMTAAALQFALAHPVVSTVIPGADTAAQLRQNIVALGQTLPSAFWLELRERGLVRALAPLPGGV